MNELEIRYALSKQLDSAHTLESSYGAIQLDDEMRSAISSAVRPILQARLDDLRQWPDFDGEDMA